MESNEISFRLKENYKDRPPTSAEYWAWGAKVFRLISTIFPDDRTLTSKLTNDLLEKWPSLIAREKDRARRAKIYRSKPDRIIYNRYHVIQERLFPILQEEEIEQERNLAETQIESVEEFIHPWIMILRYVKHILSRTNAVSEFRLIGICRILRKYSYKELVELFDHLSPQNKKDYRAHLRNIEQYHIKNTSKLFGNSLANKKRFEPGLKERFESFFESSEELGEPSSPTHPFRTDAEDHAVVSWIKEQLKNQLSPWGVEPEHTEDSATANRRTPLSWLRYVSHDKIEKPEDYCSFDELRMLILTDPVYFEHFIAEGEKPVKMHFQELQLPTMRTRNINKKLRNDPPPQPLEWTKEEFAETLIALEQTIYSRRQGWRAEKLVVRIKGQTIADKNLEGFENIEISLQEKINFVDVYLKKAGEESFFYQLLIDYDVLLENQHFEENYQAEGRQKISFRLVPDIQENDLKSVQLTIHYHEPWHWQIFRAWHRRTSTVRFFDYSIGLRPVFGIMLIVLLGISAWIYVSQQEKPNLQVSVDLAQEKVNQNITPPETPTTGENGNVGNESNNSVNDPNVPGNTKPIKNKNEQPNKEKEQKFPKQNMSFPDNRLQFAQNSVRDNELEIQREIGDLANIRVENDIQLPSPLNNSSRTGTSGSIPWKVSPNGTYIRTNEVTLSWPQVAGVAGYIVEIVDLSDTPVVEELSLKTSFSTSIKLPSDAYFRWEVRPLDPEGKALARPMIFEGNFRTLSDAAKQRVADAEKKYSSSPLLLGIVYLKNGLMIDARRQFDIFAKDDPQKAKTVNRLLIQMKELPLR